MQVLIGWLPLIVLQLLLPFSSPANVGLAAAQSTVPLLPQVYLDTTYVEPIGSTVTVNAGGDLQKALDAAKPGDEVVLQAGATFTGNFVLRNKLSGAGWITIRSSRMDALPVPGKRVQPSDAGAMPKIVTTNTSPALATEQGAHNYRIMGVEIAVAPKVRLNYMTVYLGDGKTLEELPTDLIFDRTYIHGSVLCHCKQGVMLNSRRTSVIDSYISEYHTIDQDAQAILGYNGPGPFKIVNNYLEASTENILFGGATASISGLVPSDIEFRRNYLAKPTSWFTSSIIPAPQSLRATGGVSGALSSGVTYYYTVVAVGEGDYVSDLNSDPAAEVAVALAGEQTSVSLTWSSVSYGETSDFRKPKSFFVYRTTDAPNAKTRSWTRFSVAWSETPAFTDTGTGGASGSPSRGRRWLAKNLFELKNAQRVLIDGNVMEYSWLHGQMGFAIVITPRIENGAMRWAVAQDLTFTNNLIRHAGGGALILGMDDSAYCSSPQPSTCQQSSRVLFNNNIFDDISYKHWGGRGWLFHISSADALTIDHNTGINDSSSIFVMSTNTRLTVTNNIMFGDVIGEGTVGGKTTFAKSGPGATFSNNVVVGAAARYYDASVKNDFPASASAVGFVDLTGGDYQLGPKSPYRGDAADGRDPGVEFAGLKKAVAGVVAGISDPGAAPEIASVLNAMSLSDVAVAPGSLISVFGVNLSRAVRSAQTDPLPRDLADVALTISGVNAPILSVSPGQIDAQVPYEIEAGTANAIVTVAGVSSSPLSFTVRSSAPGLVLADSGRALAVNADWTLNGPSNPAPAGGGLTLCLTGGGAVAPAVGTGQYTPIQPLSLPVLPVHATVGGQDADVLFAGLMPGTVGIVQVNLTLPLLTSGDYPVIITVGDAASNSALVSVAGMETSD